MKARNRLFAILLALAMVVTYMPGLAYATEDQPAEEPLIEEDAGEEEDFDAPQEEAGEIQGQENSEEEETPAEPESTPEDEVVVVEEKPAPEEVQLPEEDEKSGEEDSVLSNMTLKPIGVTPDVEVADSDELLWGFLNKELPGGETPSNGSMLKSRKAPRGSQLEEYESNIYEYLKTQIEEFTDPNKEATLENAVFDIDLAIVLGHPLERVTVNGNVQTYKVTADEMAALQSLNVKAILGSLLADMPFDLFWFDKSIENAFSFSSKWGAYYPGDEGEYLFVDSPSLEFSLKVSADYSADGATGTTAFDLNKINAVKTTITSAGEIIESAANYNDYDKLVEYKEAICNRASYNNAAAYNSQTPYGDPWQVIYVFDGDMNTKVVCEGYSKAFQYLCDNTDFDSDEIDCYPVTGTMSSSNDGPQDKPEEHMWNILHMDDGMNYIADITNSDEGIIGCNSNDPDGSFLFLNGYESGTVTDGYSYSCGERTFVSYTYDKETEALYASEELTMSHADYGKEIGFEFDSLYFDGVKNGEAEWAHYYPLDNKEDTISLSEMNVTVRGDAGERVSPDNYEITIRRTWWDEAAGKDEYEIVENTNAIGLEGNDEELGYTQYELIAVAKDESKYSGEVTGTFYVADKHTLHIPCSEVGYGNAVWSGEWRMHRYYKFMGAPDGLSVIQSADPDTQLVEGRDYRVTYYVSGEGSDEWNVVFSDDNPVGGVPSQPGRYFARVEGIGDYYGVNDVLLDIGDLVLVEKDSRNLWSNGKKVYDVVSNLDGEVKFIIGINGNRDEWDDPAYWKTILDEGTDYSYDASKKELTLNGESIYKKTGECAIDVVAYIETSPDSKTFIWESVGVQKAELNYDFREDREMLPGWDDYIDGGGEIYIRNGDFPWGENFRYEVESVEIVSGVGLLDDEDTDIEEVTDKVDGVDVTKYYLDGDEDGYWFRIFNLKEWEDYTGEDKKVTFRITYSCDALGIDSETYDYTVSVVPEIYEVFLHNPSDWFEGLPGHEFDVNVEARHKYYDDNGRYCEDSNDLKYKWSYMIGNDDDWTEVPEGGLKNNDFAEFTINDDGNGHLKFKALPEGKDEEEFFVRLDLVDETGQDSYADDCMSFRCKKDYTVIWPYSLRDIEMGQKIEEQKFEVRQYSSGLEQTSQNDGYVTVPSDEIEFTWRDFDENAVRITGSDDNEVPNGRPAVGDVFSIERLEDWDTHFRLEARWDEVVDETTGKTEERRVETEYRFHERDYNINFDEHDRWLYTDIYDYNEAHEDDEGFEPEDPSHRLPLGDWFGEDWDDTFELDLKVGHWEDDNTEDGQWIEDEMLDEQGEGFFSLFFPKDYTVETDADGNVHVALTDHYLKKVEGHDDVRVEAKLYLKEDEDKENLLGRDDAWFHIEETFVEYRDMRENEDILPDQGDTINRWNEVRVENTEYRGGNAEYEVTGVEISDGWEYLTADVVVSEGNKHYVKKNEDKNYDPAQDEDHRGPWAWWDYRIKDAAGVRDAMEDTGDEEAAVSFKVTYKDYDYKAGDPEKTYEFTRTIVGELSHTWIDLNGASDNGGPGAEFTLFGGAWYEFVNDEGRVEGTNEGFTFGYEITEGEEFATLTHEAGSPVATLKFKDIEIPEDGLNENIQVTITAYREDENGEPVEVARGDKWFWLSDWHAEMFMSFDGGGTWVTNIDPRIMPGTSADIRFQMRQYDSSLGEDALSDASGRYYVIEAPEFWWDFDESMVQIAAVYDEDDTRTETELGKFDVVDDTDTFCITRLTGDGMSLRLMTDFDEWDEDEPFDYGVHMDRVETNLRDYRLDLVNEVLVNEYWRIVIGEGTSITDPEFTVTWNGMELPEDAYTLHIFEVTGFDEETHQRIYGNEVTGPLVAGQPYAAYATIKDEYKSFYEGTETEHYEFEVYSDKSINAFHVDFVDTETGEPVWYGPEDMPETPDFVDFFFKAHPGSARPKLFMGQGETVLDPQYYEAKYCEMEFSDAESEWEPIDDEEWFAGFPAKAGVYLCVIEAKAPYSGTQDWIDLIKVEHTLTHHDADPVDCTIDHWNCSVCGRNYSDEAAKNELVSILNRELRIAKDNALAELSKININNYSGAEKTNVENALKAARAAIRNAATVGEVTSAKNTATSTISAQKTNAQKAAAAVPKTKPEKVDLKAVKGLKLKAAKGKITVKWKKATKKELKTFQGYEIQYTLNGTFTDYQPKKVGKKKASATLKKLLKKKKYKVRIRRYRDDGSVLHVSPWKQKKTKTK